MDVDENIAMMEVQRCPPSNLNQSLGRFRDTIQIKDKVPSPCPLFNVYFDSSKYADTAKVRGGGGGEFRNKPLDVTGGDDSSLNILRKYGSNLGQDDSNVLCNSFIRKPSSNNKNIRRKRTTFEDEEDSKAEAEGLNFMMMVHNNNKTNKRNPPPPRPKPTDNLSTGPTTKSSSSSSSISSVFQFQSSRQIQVEGCDNNNNNATATLETETEFSKDSRSIRERVLKQSAEAALLLKAAKRASSADDDDYEKPLYKGIHGYIDYRAGFRREQTVSSEKASGAHGPLRASAHIRVSTRFDYQPDICKDYKETGYCGFGDSCKFLHDRGDYKSGWQMEADWDEAEKVRKRDLALGGGDDVGEAGPDQSDDDAALPFACSICRGPFVDAVVTTCKHYFCEHCALKHHAKKKECFVCNKRTFGIFNTAQEIRKKMAAEGK